MCEMCLIVDLDRKIRFAADELGESEIKRIRVLLGSGATVAPDDAREWASRIARGTIADGAPIDVEPAGAAAAAPAGSLDVLIDD